MHHGKVKNLGMIISGKALEGLPDQDKETLIQLPQSVFAPPYHVPGPDGVPMITLDFLKGHSSFCKDVPVPTTVSKPGYYPTNYSVSYDVSTDTISIMLNKLVWLNDKTTL